MSNSRNCQFRHAHRTIKCVLAVIGLLAATVAFAATATLTPQSALAASCTIDSASTLNFAKAGMLSANVDQTSTLQVTCTNSTPYNIGLDAGRGGGATVATRKMSSGHATVDYSLYSDRAYTTVWGEMIGSGAVAATASGSGQNYTVYGRVPSQAIPAPGAYSDTITVTVTY